jgi:hypothetical protein
VSGSEPDAEDFSVARILSRLRHRSTRIFARIRSGTMAHDLPLCSVERVEAAMIPREYLVMYLGANLIALAILTLAFWRPRIARWVWVAIFLWAAAVNTMTAAKEPWMYLAYAGLTPSDLYRDFINGWFSRHIQPMVLAIAGGQLAIAILLSGSSRARLMGVAGASVFLLAIAPLGAGSGFPFSLFAVASLIVMECELSALTARRSPAAAFIPRPDVVDHHEIAIAAPADLVFFEATRVDLQSLPVVRAIFRIRGWLLGDTSEPPPKPLGIVADTMVLGWGLLAHTPCRTIVMGAAARPWTRNVTFRTIPSDQFAAFAEPDYVKIVWTLEAEPIGQGRTRFHTETRVVATDAASRRKFFWYWLVFGLGIRFIRWNMLWALHRKALRHHREWQQGGVRPTRARHA